MLLQIENEFKKKHPIWLVSYNYIAQAHVPVIKLKCKLDASLIGENFKYSKLLEQFISVDITQMNESHNGIKCVELVSSYL